MTRPAVLNSWPVGKRSTCDLKTARLPSLESNGVSASKQRAGQLQVPSLNSRSNVTNGAAPVPSSAGQRAGEAPEFRAPRDDIDVVDDDDVDDEGDVDDDVDDGT